MRAPTKYRPGLMLVLFGVCAIVLALANLALVDAAVPASNSPSHTRRAAGDTGDAERGSVALQTFTLYGVAAKDGSGAALVTTDVELRHNGAAAGTGHTDGSGNFHIDGVSIGKYSLKSIDYESDETDFEGPGHPGESQVNPLRFTMKPTQRGWDIDSPHIDVPISPQGLGPLDSLLSKPVLGLGGILLLALFALLPIRLYLKSQQTPDPDQTDADEHE